MIRKHVARLRRYVEEKEREEAMLVGILSLILLCTEVWFGYPEQMVEISELIMETTNKLKEDEE